MTVGSATAARGVDRLVNAGLIDRRPQVTAHRRRDIARIIVATSSRERRELVRALTALTAAGREPAAHVDGHL